MSKFLLQEKYKQLYKILNSNKNQKIFIITGKNSFYKSGANKIIENVLKKKTNKIYFKKKSVPEFNELIEIYKNLNNFKPDIFLAIGGGAVLDYAKMANCINSLENLDKKIVKQTIKLKKNFRLIAIPTTAGSGAEVTSNAVIYIKNVKFSLEGKEIEPDEFFLIPELILNLKKSIKASSGFDALSQAVESIISVKSNSESISYAKKSIKLIKGSFTDYYKNPNLENSLIMSKAAYFSGKAIGLTKTTAPHAVSYPFTAHYGISHGHAVSLTLNKFLKHNIENISLSQCKFDLRKRYEILYKSTGTKNFNDLDAYLTSLKRIISLEQNFVKLGVNIKKKINLILNGVNIRRLSNNPVKIKKEDIVKILTQ